MLLCCDRQSALLNGRQTSGHKGACKSMRSYIGSFPRVCAVKPIHCLHPQYPSYWHKTPCCHSMPCEEECAASSQVHILLSGNPLRRGLRGLPYGPRFSGNLDALGVRDRVANHNLSHCGKHYGVYLSGQEDYPSPVGTNTTALPPRGGPCFLQAGDLKTGPTGHGSTFLGKGFPRECRTDRKPSLAAWP